jgi:hypothetical protein
MIRYAIKDSYLKTSIDKAVQKKKKNSTWSSVVRSASKKTKGKPANIWSLIKSVYLKIQFGKCGFCERMLGADERLPYEKDVEHFRPKSRLDFWPSDAVVGDDSWPVDLPKGLHKGKGWRKLVYHRWNFLVACKECNQRWKRNFFPTLNKPQFKDVDPIKLRIREAPYLIYPLHDASKQKFIDEDPEKLILWDGAYALPYYKPSRFEYWQARTSIYFFGLNDSVNIDRLLIPRAHRLKTIGMHLREFERKTNIQTANKYWTKHIIPETSPSLPHTACVNAVLRLYKTDSKAAFRAISNAEQLLLKLMPPSRPLLPPKRSRRT